MNAVFKISCLFFILCLLPVSPAYAKKAKEQKSLKSVMISASASMGQIQNLLAEGDYFSIAERCMQLARSFKSLERRRPPKGSKSDWDAIHQNMVALSFKAIGACGDEDTSAIRDYVQQMLNYMQAGHKMFR